MPKLTGPLFSVEARKALGKMLTYQRRPGGASAYGYKKPKVPLTLDQLYQRHTIYAAVKAWKYAHADLKAYYETIAQGQGQSGYSLWMHERAFKCGGAVLFLPMVECAGAVLHDVSGKSNDGDIVGASWEELSAKSWCLSLDGDGDYIDVPDAFDELTEGTLLAWINLAELGLHHDLFMSSPGVATNDYLTFYPNDSNKLQFRVVDSGGTFLVNCDIDDALPIETWHLVALRVTASGNAILVNGVKQDVTYYDGDASVQAFFNDVSATQETFIGRWFYNGSYYARFKGFIALPRIIGRGLTDSELLTIENTERSLFGA